MGAFITKYKYLIAFGIFIVHYVFKTYALGINGFWYDECYSVYVGSDTIGEIIRSTQETDPNPPLYLVLLHYWMYVFGDSEFGVRLLSVVASCFSASVLFLLCVRFLNWQTAIFASIMFFTSNELYYYAQEARTFALVILFVLLSYYYYLSIFKNTKIWQPFLLGICNAVVFYLHLLATFSVVAQIICLPFILINIRKSNAIEDRSNVSFNISIVKKVLLYYLLSFVVFAVAVLPWVGRLINIMEHEGKTYWLAKPTIREFKDCIYDFFNSKELYQVYIISFAVILLLLITFKKFREQGLQKKIFIFALITGPFMIYMMYIIAGFSSIFLKRYVLFTIIGFILLYSYTFSAIKINFYLKLIIFLVLGIFTFKKLIFPRESYYEYDKATVFLKKVKQPDTFITSDLQDVFSYYYAKDLFYVRPYTAKRDSLIARGIYIPYNNEFDWPVKLDLSKYKHIYYTNTFAGMYDPENKVGKLLGSKFVLKDQINRFKGIFISHYINPKNQSVYLQASNGKYISTGPDRMVIADKEKITPLGEYSLITYENGECAFLSQENLFLSANLGHLGEVFAVAKNASDWEKFKMIEMENGFVAFRAFNGKYLSVDEKTNQLVAAGSSIGKNEKFRLADKKK